MDASPSDAMNLSLADAFLKAAALIGEDGNGKNALVGFLTRAARHHPRLFVQLWEKVLPHQLVKEDGSDQPIEEDRNSVPQWVETAVPEWLKGIQLSELTFDEQNELRGWMVARIRQGNSAPPGIDEYPNCVRQQLREDRGK